MAAGNGSGKRRRLTVPEKYQVFFDVVSGQGSQREIADKWRVDRSTVVHVCKTAKQGALDADVLHGQARIRGTRIPVSLVLGCLAEGMSEGEILEQYPTLTVEGIRAAAAYAAELTDEQILPLSGQ